MKGSPMKRNFNVGTSPMKQQVTNPRKTTNYGDERIVETHDDRPNKKGQSQDEVITKRWKRYQNAIKANNALPIHTMDLKDFRQKSTSKQKELIAEAEAAASNVDLRQQQFYQSSDSTANVNRLMDIEADKDD